MLEELFSALTRAVESTPWIAIGASVLWGVLSILLSPCHLASIPLVIGFIDQQNSVSTKRAFALSLLFSIGILITIALIGIVTAQAGRVMGDVGRWGYYAVAAIFFAVGLILLDVIPFTFSSPQQIQMQRKGLIGAFLLGLIFGVALGPCTFAYMAPMLAVTFKMAATNWLYGAFLLLMYGVGHCGVIVAAGTSFEWIEHYLRWNERSKGTVVVRKICGILVIAGGLWLLYTAP